MTASPPHPTRREWLNAGCQDFLPSTARCNSRLFIDERSVTGRVAYNAEQFDHQQAAVSWLQ